MRYLDRFRLVVLDMHRTFMFGADRFGPEEDFAATYRALTDRPLEDAAVSTVIRALHGRLDAAYHDPARFDDFPSVAEVLAALPEARALDAARRRAIEAVLARHEMGQLPESHAAALRALAGRHRLGLISNLWSLPGPWLQQLAAHGVDRLFDVMLFSSETRHIKPSPRLFHLLLDRADVAPGAAVYVGDDAARDVVGAKAAGMAAVWINAARAPLPAGVPAPDREIGSLLDLAGLPA